ncbi:MAG: peptide/nickel transport system permease protein, partial [Yoonia sp.]
MTNIYDAAVDQSAKDAYFTASQSQLIWTRFKKQKAAMVGAWVLVLLILSGLFAPFLTPYDPTIAGRDKDYLNGAPTVVQFCDDNGCSLRPFIYGVERERSIET